MSSESARKAARAWLEDATFHEAGWEALDAEDRGAVVDRLAARLEDYARAWAKELGMAWDRRGEDAGVPAVPVLQGPYDDLCDRLAAFEDAVDRGAPGTPPGLLAIAVAELRKRLDGYERDHCEICGARFAEGGGREPDDAYDGEPNPRCHPCVENQRLRDLVAARDRDLADAAGDLPVPVPEPGTPEAKLLAANVLLRRKVAELVGGGPAEGARLDSAEELLRGIREIATTADGERQGEILRWWGIQMGAETPLGCVLRLCKARVRSDGSVAEMRDCPQCLGTGQTANPGKEWPLDCDRCRGLGRLPKEDT